MYKKRGDKKEKKKKGKIEKFKPFYTAASFFLLRSKKSVCETETQSQGPRFWSGLSSHVAMYVCLFDAGFWLLW